jgi:acetylornithine/succinyldiaminopimelate/putrescine aminotransferase
VAAAAGLVVLETVSKPEFLAGITRKGEKILAAIKGWNHGAITEVRGRGLMIGIDIDRDAWPILEAGIARAKNASCGLLILSAGQNILRLLPPYIISDSEIDQGLEILQELLG